MTPRERADLIAAAVPEPRRPVHWADLGAGDGAFTLPLAERLGPGSHVLAIDRDGRALARLRRQTQCHPHASAVDTIPGDFTSERLPAWLDGVLMANALHYVPRRRQLALLVALAAVLAPAGRIVVMEYDLEQGNRWVPHPVSARRFAGLANEAGLADAEVVAYARSRYWGLVYCGLAFRAPPARE